MYSQKVLFKTQITLILLFLITLNFSCSPTQRIPPKTQLEQFYTPEQVAEIEDCRKLLNKYYINIIEEERPVLRDEFYSQQFLSFNAGASFNSFSDPSLTSFCGGADYNYRLSEDNPNNAFYARGGAGIKYSTADDFSSTMGVIGGGVQFFQGVTERREVDLVASAGGAYIGGNLENFGVEEDVNGWTAGLELGVNFNFKKWSLGFRAPLLGYTNLNYESDFSEFQQNGFFVGLNKHNMVMANIQIPIGRNQ